MYAAHCSPKISACMCECTCQTALPGPNQPGSADRGRELHALEEVPRTSLSKRSLSIWPTIWCGRYTATPSEVWSQL